MCEALHSISQQPIKLDMVAHPGTWEEMETGGLADQGCSWFHSKFKASLRHMKPVSETTPPTPK